MDYRFKKMNCLNCNNTIQTEQKFCPECGQKTSITRLNTSDILHDAIHAFTHTDKGILYLLRWLIVKPGTIAKEYVQGKRKKYFNPFTFLILVIGITTIMSAKFNLMASSSEISNPLNEFLSKNVNLVIFFIVPIQALFTKLLFGKQKINFAESVILSSFTSGERSIVFTLLVTPLIILLRDYYGLIIGLYTFLFALYYGFACCQYFENFKAKYFFKGLLVIALSQITVSIVIGLGVYMYYTFLKN